MRPVIKHMASTSFIVGLCCSGIFPFAYRSVYAEDGGNNVAHESVSTYVVKLGDTISKILFDMGIGTPSSPHRIYGKNGWMQRLTDMNPNVTLSKIYPGQKIVMPVLAQESVASTDRNASGEQCIPSEGAARFEKYTIQKGDTISKLLYKRGVGHPESKERLFGEQGWVLRTQKFNTNVDNWQSLHVGQKIVLLYPNQDKAGEDCLPKQELAEKEAQESDEIDNQEEETSSDFSLAAKPLQKTPAEVVKRPEEASIEQIAALPKDMQKEIAVEAIAAKLDIDTVADMDEEVAEKIPPQAVERRAQQISISDGGSPAMQKLFKDLKRTPAAFVGARARFSFGSSDSLASKMRVYSLFGEIREGALEGLRLTYEKAPKYKVGLGRRKDENMKFERGFLAWALRMPFTLGSAELFVTPRVGAMKFGASVLDPVVNQPNVLLNIKADQVNLAGLALDAEFATYFYKFRFHVGHDASLSKSGVKTTSTQVGFDALFKGEELSIFGANLNPGYTAFVAYEHLKAEEETNAAKLDLKIPSFGLSISLYLD